MEEMTLEKARELAELYPLAQCECGEITLGGSDVVIADGETTFPEHTHETTGGD
jgi:hypothetical protein